MTWSTATGSPRLDAPGDDLGLLKAFAEIGEAELPALTAPSPPQAVTLPLQAGDGVEDAVGVRQMELLEVGGRVGDVEAGDAEDGRFEVMEAPLGQAGAHLGAVAAEARRLVHDDGPAGAEDGGGQGLGVEGRQRAEVDDLDIAVFLDGGRGGSRAVATMPP